MYISKSPVRIRLSNVLTLEADRCYIRSHGAAHTDRERDETHVGRAEGASGGERTIILDCFLFGYCGRCYCTVWYVLVWSSLWLSCIWP